MSNVLITVLFLCLLFGFVIYLVKDRLRKESFHVSVLTCIAHVIIKGRVNKVAVATGFVARLRVPAVLVFGCGVGVGAQISSFQRWLCL